VPHTGQLQEVNACDGAGFDARRGAMVQRGKKFRLGHHCQLSFGKKSTTI
jgi:hypothetical protein